MARPNAFGGTIDSEMGENTFGGKRGKEISYTFVCREKDQKEGDFGERPINTSKEGSSDRQGTFSGK